MKNIRIQPPKNLQTMQNMSLFQPQYEIKFIYFAEPPSLLLSQRSSSKSDAPSL